MGQSTNGILAYGYDFGECEPPPLAGVDEYESWRPPEFTAEPGSDEYYDFDFHDWAERKLLATAGRPVEEESYFDPEETKKYYGVWFQSYCSGEAPMYLLVTHKTTVYRGWTEDIDFVALERQRVEEGWDDKLAAVLKVLGIGDLVYRGSSRGAKEGQLQKPRWLIASYKG